MSDDNRQYAMVRFQGIGEISRIENLSYKEMIGITGLIWGRVPEDVLGGGELDQEWKLQMGGGNWVVIRRTK